MTTARDAGVTSVEYCTNETGSRLMEVIECAAIKTARSHTSGTTNHAMYYAKSKSQAAEAPQGSGVQSARTSRRCCGIGPALKETRPTVVGCDLRLAYAGVASKDMQAFDSQKEAFAYRMKWTWISAS